MTYIGNVNEAESAMSDERLEQERIQGFCPEGVEDFAGKWLSATSEVLPMVAASGHGLPYIAVPRSPTPDAQRIASLEAELAAARAALAAAAVQALKLTGQTLKAAPGTIAGALRAWSGAGRISQLTGKPTWV